MSYGTRLESVIRDEENDRNGCRTSSYDPGRLCVAGARSSAGIPRPPKRLVSGSVGSAGRRSAAAPPAGAFYMNGSLLCSAAGTVVLRVAGLRRRTALNWARLLITEAANRRMFRMSSA